MNLFEVNFLEKTRTLFFEGFQFKKYKCMHPVLAVFCGILMLPFVAASFLVGAGLFFGGFIFEITNSLVRSLHSIVKNEGEEKKHATQFIIYLLSWPTVFFSYVLECFFIVFLVPTYAVLSFFIYVWSFGGIKYHAFVSDTNDISVDVKGRYKALPLVMVLVGFSCAVLAPMIHGLIYLIKLYYEYSEQYWGQAFVEVIYPKYMFVAMIFTMLYSLLGMARYPHTVFKKSNREN